MLWNNNGLFSATSGHQQMNSKENVAYIYNQVLPSHEDE
jgi:hypothetical protein